MTRLLPLSSVQVNPADSENYISMVEMTFVFSMIWSVCASVDEEGRKRIDSYVREIEGSFPNKVGTLGPANSAVLPPGACECLHPGGEHPALAASHAFPP